MINAQCGKTEFELKNLHFQGSIPATELDSSTLRIITILLHLHAMCIAAEPYR